MSAFIRCVIDVIQYYQTVATETELNFLVFEWDSLDYFEHLQHV